MGRRKIKLVGQPTLRLALFFFFFLLAAKTIREASSDPLQHGLIAKTLVMSASAFGQIWKHFRVLAEVS